MAQSLMRELGALMNSMAGINPNDDVAVLAETLKCVRALNPRISAPPPTAHARTVSQPLLATNRCDPLISSRPRLVTMPDHPEHSAQVCYQYHKLERGESAAGHPSRSFPTACVLCDQRAHPAREARCVGTELQKAPLRLARGKRLPPAQPPPPGERAHTPPCPRHLHALSHPFRLLMTCGCDICSCGPCWR